MGDDLYRVRTRTLETAMPPLRLERTQWRTFLTSPGYLGVKHNVREDQVRTSALETLSTFTPVRAAALYLKYVSQLDERNRVALAERIVADPTSALSQCEDLTLEHPIWGTLNVLSICFSSEFATVPLTRAKLLIQALRADAPMIQGQWAPYLKARFVARMLAEATRDNIFSRYFGADLWQPNHFGADLAVWYVDVLSKKRIGRSDLQAVLHVYCNERWFNHLQPGLYFNSRASWR
jgi:hypothetical protein